MSVAVQTSEIKRLEGIEAVLTNPQRLNQRAEVVEQEFENPLHHHHHDCHWNDNLALVGRGNQNHCLPRSIEGIPN